MVVRGGDSPAMQQMQKLDSERGASMFRKRPGSDMPTVKPSEAKVQFRSSSDRIREAMKKGDYDSVDGELGKMRGNYETLPGRMRDLPMQERYLVPSISRMYQDGAALIREGRESGDDAKISLGLEKIERANRDATWDKLENCPSEMKTKKNDD